MNTDFDIDKLNVHVFDIDKLDVHVFYDVNPLYRSMFSPLDTLHVYYTQEDVTRSEVVS